MKTPSKYSQKLSSNPPLLVHTSNHIELKSAIDDQVKSILSSNCDFVENHWAQDRHLILGYLSVLLAFYGSGVSYLISFETTKLELLGCIFGYYVLNGIMSLLQLVSKRDRIYIGTRVDPLGLDPVVSCVILSKLDKVTGDLKLVFTLASKNKSTNGFTLQKSFGSWFDCTGKLVSHSLEKDVMGPMENALSILRQSSVKKTQ